jgi:acyl-CoA synthetase (AMP-forming)/AMP-acid ligase II
MSSLLAMVHGIALVMPAAQFDPLATLQAIEAERCTLIYGVPTMFIAELEHPDFRKYDMRTLRSGIMAGAPCPVEVMKRVVSEMHCSGMTVAYGQTESSPGSPCRRRTTPGASRGDHRAGAARDGSEDRRAVERRDRRDGRTRRVMHARLPGDEGLRSGAGSHGAAIDAEGGCARATWR